ncbi:hypothetical protein ABZP36_022905 [Zizania latifolia]
MLVSWQSNLNNSASNLQDSSGRPFAASFSGQSGSVPGFHHSGLHNIHGNYNLPNIPGSLAQRNAAMSGLPSSGVQQPGGSISGRFASNNLPVAMSQIPHGHSGVSGRGMNVGGGPAFSSSLNIGGTIQASSSNLGTGGSRNSVPGMSVSPALGNLGPRIPSSVGNIVGGSNIGRNISSGGLSVPSIASRINLSGNAGSGGINVQGSSRMINGFLQQGSPQMMNMVGSSYPTSGGSLSQNQIQAGNNSLSSMGMIHDASDSGPFDINDFPQLTGRPSSAGGPQGQYGSLRKQGVGVNAIVQQNQEFSIQNEDFPALPGYKGGTSDYAMELHHKEQLHDNVAAMQAQQYPIPPDSSFNLFQWKEETFLYAKEHSAISLRVLFVGNCTRQESFEELQQLFVDMFQDDLDSGFCNGPSKMYHAQAQSQTPTWSTSPSTSPSPPPPLATEAESPSCNGLNKRGSSAMDSGKPPRASEVGVGQSQSGFCFEKSDAKQGAKMRGGRRNGRKQKLSSKHDVSSEDEISGAQRHSAA